MAKDLMAKAPDYPTIRQLFETKTIQDQLQMAAASTIRIDQMARIFLSVIRNSEKLLGSSQQSLLTCLFAFAQLGLSPEPFLGQAYAVPFWNSRQRLYEATFIPGYRGMIVLGRRSGELNNLTAQNVFKNDHFKIQFGLNEILEHIPANDGDRGEFIGSWTKFTYHHGDPTFEYMMRSDIDKIMQRTKSKDKDGQIVGPWITDYPEMSKKTVIKRHMKLAPLSVEDHSLARAAYAEDLALEGKSQSALFIPDDREEAIEVEFRDWSMEFGQVFGDDQGNIDQVLHQYLDAVAKGNNESISQVMKSAVENQEEFLKSFNDWKYGQQKKESPKKDKKKSAKKSGSKKEKSATSRKGQGDDKGKSKKDAPVASEQGSGGGNEEDQGEDEELSFDEVVKTDEWNELSMLKEQYPKFYLKTFKGQIPRTLKAVINGIDSINNMINEAGGDGIPDA